MSEKTPIMEVLKVGTQDLHDSAENHAYQVALIKGELPVEGYVAHLEQMYLVHKSLEAKLREHRNAHPAFEAVITEDQYQEPYLLEDFAHFGVDANSIQSTEGTEQVIQAIENAAESAPIKLLGLHYVLEGSNNGGRYIAKKLAQVYSFADGQGLKYFDPYGEEQRPKWMKFRETMNTIDFTDEERDLLLEGAKEMFHGAKLISDSLVAATA